MNKVQTTFPNAPSGQINPEVPLGVSATLVETPVPLDNPPFDEKNINQQQWIYYDNFEISDNDTVGKNLFNWNSYRPLGDYWLVDIDNKGMKVNVPQALKEVYFASFANIEWYIKYEPIKVTDSRVEVVQFYDYDGIIDPASMTFGSAATSSYNKENIQFTFDDPTKVIIFKPPLYQMATKVPNNDSIKIDSLGNVTQYIPPFVPTTSLSLKLKSKFIHNNLQPSKFTVNVYVLPIIRAVSQLHSKCLNTNVPHQSLPLIVFSPQPWWLKRLQTPIETLFFEYFDKIKISKYSLKQILKSVGSWYAEGIAEEGVKAELERYIEKK